MNEIYALHAITSRDAVGFDAARYSRFKFGDGDVARRFGRELAQGFATQRLPMIPKTAQLVVLPSPFSFIPTASYWMTQAFTRELNRALVEQERSVAQEVKIGRSITYRDDYGNLTFAERIRLIGNDTFRVDTMALEGKTLVFVDDIRITGSHQLVIERMMDRYGLANPHTFVYYGQLTNAEVHPNIENYLNYYAVKSLGDLTPIVQSTSFRINTRLVKYILNHAPADSQPFLEQQSTAFLDDLYDMALGNEYHLIAEYEPTVSVLGQLLNINQYQEL
ncbi:MAG: hypothetical protein H7Z72_08055 [Bacteroidetes bacterium]|nr:hypothetical protein [Fibrella sp.]